MGVKYHELLALTPRVIEQYAQVYNKQQQAQYDQINYQNWNAGSYVLDAITAVFGKNHRYPAKPYKSASSEPPSMESIRDKMAAFVAKHNASYMKEREVNLPNGHDN